MPLGAADQDRLQQLAERLVGDLGGDPQAADLLLVLDQPQLLHGSAEVGQPHPATTEAIARCRATVRWCSSTARLRRSVRGEVGGGHRGIPSGPQHGGARRRGGGPRAGAGERCAGAPARPRPGPAAGPSRLAHSRQIADVGGPGHQTHRDRRALAQRRRTGSACRVAAAACGPSVQGPGTRTDGRSGGGGPRPGPALGRRCRAAVVSAGERGPLPGRRAVARATTRSRASAAAAMSSGSCR